MADIRQDLSPEALISAIEANLYAWVPELAKMGRMSSSEPLGVKRAISEVRNSLFNSIMETHIPEDKVVEAVDYIITDARRRMVPVLWWTSPSTEPQEVEGVLLGKGFLLDEASPGMAVELVKLNEGLPVADGVTVQPVGQETRWSWCETMGRGFGIPSEASFTLQAWYEFLGKVDAARVVPFLADLDDKPAATSLLFLGGGVAGIYAVATVPEERRKGIGAQVTLQALLHARSLGYQVGVLEASEVGESVYRALGFREYCRINSYVYRPKKDELAKGEQLK